MFVIFQIYLVMYVTLNIIKSDGLPLSNVKRQIMPCVSLTLYLQITHGKELRNKYIY